MTTGVLYTTTEDGEELAIIDVLNPAFTVTVADSELVALAERRRWAEDEEIERGVVTTAPEDDRSRLEDDESEEDQLVSDPGRIVIVHLFLSERVSPGPLRARLEVVEAVGRLADLNELPSPARGPREHRDRREHQGEHRRRAHRRSLPASSLLATIGYLVLRGGSRANPWRVCERGLL